MRRTAILLLAVVAASLFSLASPGEAQAQPVTLTLDRVGGLVNVDDAAGRWQYEAGVVYCADGFVAWGVYMIQRRVTIGAEQVNSGAVTVTLIMGNTPADNITLQGAHAFDTGSYLGSVSATSRLWAPVRGRSFTGSTLPVPFGSSGTLTIDRLRRIVGDICDAPVS